MEQVPEVGWGGLLTHCQLTVWGAPPDTNVGSDMEGIVSQPGWDLGYVPENLGKSLPPCGCLFLHPLVLASELD